MGQSEAGSLEGEGFGEFRSCAVLGGADAGEKQRGKS